MGTSTVGTVPWTLLTNDDGIDSPALEPFAAALARDRQVRVIVPDRERSWIGKAITRHDPVFTERREIAGLETYACTGYPADAVQIGIHALSDQRPELVVSGINLGYNHGAGFLMSSGTVGAAIEAWISGIPSVAISTGSMNDWPAWRAKVMSPASGPGWARTSDLCAGILEDVLTSGAMEHCDVVSVNLPFDPDPGTPRRVTEIARVGYDRLFRSDGPGRFVHDFGGGIREYGTLIGSDVEAANLGQIAITPVRMPSAAQLPPSARNLLERRNDDAGDPV